MIVVELPLRTKNPTNNREHWRAVWKRAGKERAAACILVRPHVLNYTLPAPVTVRLVRLSAGELDSDNLRSALKSVRDGVADVWHTDDKDSRFNWCYAQERCARGKFGVRVEIGEG